MIRCKGLDRIVLVTDAMAAAAAPPGNVPLGRGAGRGRPGWVRPPARHARISPDRPSPWSEPSRTRRGSPVSALEDALRLASRQPRALFSRMGAGVAAGSKADLVVLREGTPLTVVATIVEGEVVYRQS